MIASHELLLFSDVITFTMTMCTWAWVFMRLLDLVNPRNPNDPAQAVGALVFTLG